MYSLFSKQKLILNYCSEQNFQVNKVISVGELTDLRKRTEQEEMLFESSSGTNQWQRVDYGNWIDKQFKHYNSIDPATITDKEVNRKEVMYVKT